MFSDNSKPGFVLGRKFVLSKPDEELAFHWMVQSQIKEVAENKLKIVKWFSDDAASPYSIHAIALGGVKYNKAVGDWHGPNTVSYIIRDLIELHGPDNNSIDIYISSDAVVYRDKLFRAPRRSQIILVPLRLGVHTFNRAYVPALQMLFSIPQFLGIIGGRPSASYFFIGHHDESLFYLDPHTNQQYTQFNPPNPNDLTRAVPTDLLASFVPPEIGRMSISQIDPSLTLGFYCHDQADFANLEESIKTLLPHTRDIPTLLTFEDVTPDYEAHSESGDIISFHEDDF